MAVKFDEHTARRLIREAKRSMRAPRTQKKRERRFRAIGGGGGSDTSLAWYVAVTDIPKAVSVKFGGITYRVASEGDVAPFHWPVDIPPGFAMPPGAAGNVILMELSQDENEIESCYSYYSTDILEGSRLLCGRIDGQLWVITEDCV